MTEGQHIKLIRALEEIGKQLQVANALQVETIRTAYELNERNVGPHLNKRLSVLVDAIAGVENDGE